MSNISGVKQNVLEKWALVSEKYEKTDVFDFKSIPDRINKIRDNIKKMDNTDDKEELRQLAGQVLENIHSVKAHRPNKNLILSHNKPAELKKVFLEILSEKNYNQKWENEISMGRGKGGSERHATNPIRELFGWLHIEDYPIYNKRVNEGLMNFGYRGSTSYSTFQEKFHDFKEDYKDCIGYTTKNTSHAVPLNLEIDQLFNAIYSIENEHIEKEEDDDLKDFYREVVRLKNGDYHSTARDFNIMDYLEENKNDVKIYKFNGPPEHWITAYVRKLWGLTSDYKNKWEQVAEGDVVLFHSISTDKFGGQPAIIGYGIVDDKYEKSERYWYAEHHGEGNNWPLIVTFRRMIFLGETEKIDTDQYIDDKSKEEIQTEVNYILKNNLEWSNVNAVYKHITGKNIIAQPSVVNLDIDGAIEIFDLIDEGEAMNYFILKTGSEDYEDLPEQKYQFKADIPGYRQLLDAENKAKFVYLEDNVFYGIGDIGNITEEKREDTVYYNAEVENFKEIEHVKLDAIKDDLNVSFPVQYGIIKISENDYNTIIGVPKSDTFSDYLEKRGYVYDPVLIENLLLSLKTKPFVILTGISGTGKTKVAQLFAQYAEAKHNEDNEAAAIMATKDSYEIIPVGANWTENRHIVGFYNVITGEYYRTKALDLILRAREEPDKPLFLILDEMNMSHVERYFADFLSAMESDENVPLHSSDEVSEIPKEVRLPENVFVLGTVNVDETTYMFSPKVLDRANTIEFLPYPAKSYMLGDSEDMKFDGNIEYLEKPLSNPEVKDYSIMELRERLEDVKIPGNGLLWNVLADEIEDLQTILKPAGFDFGFRVMNEISRFMYVSWLYENRPSVWQNWERYFDAQIKQKILPKLHGSRRLLQDVLRNLFEKCYGGPYNDRPREVAKDDIISDARFPYSAYKLSEMDRVLFDQNYVSFTR